MKRYAVWFTINRACNLRCKWCYATDTTFAKSMDIKLDLVKTLTDIVSDFTLKNIVLIGGEPTIHPDFLKILNIVSKVDTTIGVVTNGVKFADKNFLKECVHNGMNGVTLSLKAPNNELYKEWTGSAAIESVKKAIINMREQNVRCCVSIILSPAIYPYMKDMVNFLKEMNVSNIYLDSERPFFIKEKPVYLSSLDDLVAGYEEAFDLLENCGIPFTFKMSVPFCRLDKEFLEKLKNSGHLQSGCHVFSDSGLTFNTNGDLLMCNTLCNNPIAKFGKDFSDAASLLALKESPKFKEFYKNIIKYPDEKCVNCKDWPICGGGCRIHWLYQNPLKKGGEKV